VILFVLFALLGCGSPSTRTQAQRNPTTTCNCDALLEQAEIYDLTNDSRAEATFRSVALTNGKECPEVFLKLGMNLSHNLKFKEAAEMLRIYLQRVPEKDRALDDRDVKKFENAADLQDRVNDATRPRLSDLLEYTRQVRAFGRRRDYAIPSAERAVELYPDSVDAILLLVDVLPPTQAEKDRVEQLLNRAATIEPTNARIYTTRGWWNLHTFRRSEDAEKDFRQALSVSNNTDPTAWKGLGYVFMERGQKREAVVAFRKYLSLNKNGTPDSEIVQLIESLERNTK